jgi:hypothetical protein
MNTADLVEWQRIDPTCGLVEPWLTHNFMDEAAKKWPLKDMHVLEFGAGRSTAWWRAHCRWVDTIESNREWAYQAAEDCATHNLLNGHIHWAPIADGIPEALPRYMDLVPDKYTNPYDLIIVDGIYRTDVMWWAVDYLERNNGGILVADNWQQDFVWISPSAEEAVAGYKIHKFIQPGHVAHEGRPWQTVFWKIPKMKT